MTERLRIATFNLENLDDRPGEKPALEDRVPLMRPQLVRLDADVLCLQEVNGQEDGDSPRGLAALEMLLEGTPYADYHTVHTVTGVGGAYDERNLVVLSRREIFDHEQIMDPSAAPLYKMLTADPEPDEPARMGWERPILHARIDAGGGRTLHVLNVHLKSKRPTDVDGQSRGVPGLPPYSWKTASGWAEGFFVSSMKRVGQALEVRLVVDGIFEEDEDALIVVCGDFNADSDDVPVQAIRGDVENTGTPPSRGGCSSLRADHPRAGPLLLPLPRQGRDDRPPARLQGPPRVLQGIGDPQRAPPRRVGRLCGRRQVPRERPRARARAFRGALAVSPAAASSRCRKAEPAIGARAGSGGRATSGAVAPVRRRVTVSGYAGGGGLPGVHKA